MKLLLYALFMLAFSACNAQDPVDSREKEIVFRGVNVIPMDREELLTDQDVVVKEGRISAMGKSGKVKYGKEAMLVDGKGKYLLPGLSEMHAHVPPVNDLEPMKEVLQLFTAHGITTIRGMLGHPRHLELRALLDKGDWIGPRFYTSGPSFNGNTVKTTAAADSMVRAQKKAGYDFLKLHPGLTRENFDAVARTAKEVKIPFAGHVSFDVGVWHAIESGYATIDHLDGFVEGLVPGIDQMTEQQTGLFGMLVADRADSSRIPALMNALRSAQVWVVPTQALAERWFSPWRDAESFRSDPAMKYMAPNTLANWVNAKQNLEKNAGYDSTRMDAYIRFRRKLIYECNRQGVKLLLGSDAPQVFNVPGVSTHQELEYLVAAGLTPYEALKTGTVNVAEFYGLKDAGIVRQGAVADLVLLDANPLADITNSQKIAGVLVRNKWLPAQLLGTALKELEKK